MNRWSIAIVAPNRERTASERIAKIGVGTFHPRLVTRTVHRGRHVEVCRPMLPGYLFVQPGRWREVLMTPGVHGYLMDSGHPAVISSEVLHGIRSRCNRDGLCYEDALPPEELFEIGEQVRIVAGSLSGYPASYEGPGPRKDTSIVSIHLLGGVQAEVRTSSLSKSNPR